LVLAVLPLVAVVAGLLPTDITQVLAGLAVPALFASTLGKEQI
jgi:hypothetical protein